MNNVDKVQEETPEASTPEELEIQETETLETETQEQGEETESPQVQDSEEGERLTRGERRKQQLQEKNEQTRSEILGLIEQNRQALNTRDQVKQDPKTVLEELLEGRKQAESDDDELITADDYGKELDPQELNRRYKERLAKTQEKISKDVVSRVKSEIRYETMLETHEKDAQQVLESEELKSNPTLRELVEQQYLATNRVLGQDGQYHFVPAVTMSQTLSNIKSKLSRLTGQQQAELRQRLQDQADSSAITPSNQTPADHKAIEDAEAFNYARQSGRTEDWAKLLKKRMFG